MFSCADDQADCLAQAGKSLGAAKLIYGNVKRSGGEIVLSLKQIDVARGVIEGSTVETLPKKKSDPSALRALSTQWIARLGGGKGAGGTAPGTLIVRSNVVGAVVMLDGAQVGTLTRKALQIDDVAPGKHEISVEKPGYGITTQQFTVGAGQALPLTLTLGGDGIETNPAGGEAEAGVTRQAAPGDEGPPQDSLRTWARTGFWVGLGLSAVSFGLAAKYGFDVHSINNELDPYRKPGHVGELSPSEHDDREQQARRGKPRRDPAVDLHRRRVGRRGRGRLPAVQGLPRQGDRRRSQDRRQPRPAGLSDRQLLIGGSRGRVRILN